MKKPGIQITLIDQKGTKGCHRGHKIGDSFDFDKERGKLCPMAMHVAFPYIDMVLVNICVGMHISYDYEHRNISLCMLHQHTY